MAVKVSELNYERVTIEEFTREMEAVIRQVKEAQTAAEEEGANLEEGPQEPAGGPRLVRRQDDDIPWHVVGAIGQDALHAFGQGQGRGHEHRGGPHADAVKEQGRIGETLGAVFRPPPHVLPLPDTEGHDVALAVPLGPLMDQEHPVPSGHEGLGPAAKVTHAQTPIAVAADVDRVARFAGVVVPGQPEAVFGFDIYPLRRQGQQLIDKAKHLIPLRVVLLPPRQVTGIVLLPHRRIEHIAKNAIGKSKESHQQRQQNQENSHGQPLRLDNI